MYIPNAFIVWSDMGYLGSIQPASFCRFVTSFTPVRIRFRGFLVISSYTPADKDAKSIPP